MADFYDNEPGSQGNLIGEKVSSSGITSLLTQVYSGQSELDTGLYSGLGHKVGNAIPIVFGRVLLSGQVTSDNAVRSDLDPSKIKKVISFVASEGPTKGIVGTDASKLENVFVGGKRVTNTTTKTQSQDVGLKEIAKSALVSGGVMMAIPYVKKMLGFDPQTGSELADTAKTLFGDSSTKKVDPNSIDGFKVDNWKKHDVLAWDEKSQKAKNKSIIDVIKESGIGVDDFVIMKDGSVVNGDVKKINLIGKWKVTDVGENTVNIEYVGTGDGGGTTDPTPDPTPNPPGTYPACSKRVYVECDPRKGSRFLFKWNGKLVGILLIDSSNYKQFTSRTAVAEYLASKTIIPANLSTKKFSLSAGSGESNTTMITITGDTTCAPCDIGNWTLECFSPALVPGSAPQENPPQPAEDAIGPCSPRKPSLTT